MEGAPHSKQSAGKEQNLENLQRKVDAAPEGLELRTAELKASQTRLSELERRLRLIYQSPSYRLARRMWRIRARARVLLSHLRPGTTQERAETTAEDVQASAPDEVPYAARYAEVSKQPLPNGHVAGTSPAANGGRKVQHLVLTRYAQKGLFYDDFSSDWLDDRLRVFSDYCVPSMAQQAASDFSWLVFCDETIDPDYLKAIEESAAAVPQFQLVLTSHADSVALPEATRPLIDEDTEVVVTTRLDNDDGLHKETIGVLQSYLPAFVNSPHPRWVVNFPRGYRYEAETGRAYAAVWLHGAFMTLFEKLRPGKRKFLNIYKVRHNWLHHTMPMHFDESIPAWLQVIHGLAESTEYRSGVALTGGNRESLVKADVDIEIDPAEIEAGFGIELSGKSEQASEAGAAPQA